MKFFPEDYTDVISGLACIDEPNLKSRKGEQRKVGTKTNKAMRKNVSEVFDHRKIESRKTQAYKYTSNSPGANREARLLKRRKTIKTAFQKSLSHLSLSQFWFEARQKHTSGHYLVNLNQSHFVDWPICTLPDDGELFTDFLSLGQIALAPYPIDDVQIRVYGHKLIEAFEAHMPSFISKMK